MASSTTCCKGGATLGIPSGIGVVAKVPFGRGTVARVPSGTGPVTRKPRTAMLIRWSRGSFALIMHLGAWKLLDIGV